MLVGERIVFLERHKGERRGREWFDTLLRVYVERQHADLDSRKRLVVSFSEALERHEAYRERNQNVTLMDECRDDC